MKKSAWIIIILILLVLTMAVSIIYFTLMNYPNCTASPNGSGSTCSPPADQGDSGVKIRFEILKKYFGIS